YGLAGDHVLDAR
nr:RecName: Full=Unknown protein 1 [Daucus carota]